WVANAIDLDLLGPDHARTAAHQRDAGAGQDLSIDRVEAADLDATSRLQRLPVERRGSDAPAEAVRFLEALRVMRGEAVQLLGDAAEVDAGAAERSVFGDRAPRAALRRHPRRPHAAAAGADDE